MSLLLFQSLLTIALPRLRRVLEDRFIINTSQYAARVLSNSLLQNHQRSREERQLQRTHSGLRLEHIKEKDSPNYKISPSPSNFFSSSLDKHNIEQFQKISHLIGLVSGRIITSSSRKKMQITKTSLSRLRMLQFIFTSRCDFQVSSENRILFLVKPVDFFVLEQLKVKARQVLMEA